MLDEKGTMINFPLIFLKSMFVFLLGINSFYCIRLFSFFFALSITMGNSFHLPMSFWFRCEAFSTYPRTYDLIHANGVFCLYKDK